MKAFLSKLGWAFPVLLLAGLLTFPRAVSEAAASAALLWWTAVLPSLLPYLIAASLLLRSGILLRVHPRLLPLALFLCGALCGYPVGAKLAKALSDRHAIAPADAARVAVRCNLPNPVFLLSVVSIGLFGDPRCAAPLLCGVYGSALLFWLPLLRMPVRRCSEGNGLQPHDLPEAIGDGVKTIGVIGGCLVFASVLGALLQAVLRLPENGLFAVLLGCLEMTCGVRAAASLPLSLSVRLALAACFVQLGGLSVLLQTASQYPVRMLRYALSKLLCAALSAAITYLLTPLFLPDALAPTFAGAAEIRQNTFALFAVAFAAALGLLFVFVFTCGLSPKKSGHSRSRECP